MTFIEKFEKLAKKIDNYSSKDLEKKYKDEIFNELKKFLEQGLLESSNKEKNAIEVINNMDIMLKYTTLCNSDWLNYEILYTKSDFLPNIAKNIRHFRFNYLKEIFSQLNLNVKNKGDDSIESVFTDNVLEFIVEKRLPSDEYTVIFQFLNDSQKQKFLELSLENNIDLDISYWNFELTDENKEFIKDNIPYFIKHSRIYDFINSYVKDEKSKLIAKKFIEENPMCVINEMLRIAPLEKKDYKHMKEFTYELVKDICRNEKVNISDIKRGVPGAYSQVFFIGNKVLKIGSPRGTLKFPNNPYILAPLLRQEVNLDCMKKTFEVAEKVDTNEIDELEVYELYKKIRDLGLIWTDVRMSNVGRLLKDNIIHWPENIEPDDKTLSLEDKVGTGTLKKGSLVIIDDDFIYKETDENIFYPRNTLFEEFESMYQAEKKRPNKKKK